MASIYFTQTRLVQLESRGERNRTISLFSKHLKFFSNYILINIYLLCDYAKKNYFRSFNNFSKCIIRLSNTCSLHYCTRSISICFNSGYFLTLFSSFPIFSNFFTSRENQWTRERSLVFVNTVQSIGIRSLYSGQNVRMSAQYVGKGVPRGKNFPSSELWNRCYNFWTVIVFSDRNNASLVIIRETIL